MQKEDFIKINRKKSSFPPFLLLLFLFLSYELPEIVRPMCMSVRRLSIYASLSCESSLPEEKNVKTIIREWFFLGNILSVYKLNEKKAKIEKSI